MTEDEAEEEDTPTAYDPSAPTPPAEDPPLRSTAPQSEYTMGQVGFGVLVLLVGVALTFGLPLVMG